MTHRDWMGAVLLIAAVASLLGFMATIMLTCMQLAKTRLVTVMAYVVMGILAVVAVLSLIVGFDLPRYLNFD